MKDTKKVYDFNNIHELYGKHVRVYFNLHKKTWSIKDKKTNRVLGWSDDVHLKDCKLIVSEKGRQRVIKEKRKNVHAYVDGIVAMNDFNDTPYAFTYNPYKYDSFVIRGGGIKIQDAIYIRMNVIDNRPIQSLRIDNYEQQGAY